MNNEFDPLTGDPLPKASAASFGSQHELDAPTASQMAMIEKLPPELQTLCKRICGARWGIVADMTPDAIAEAMKLKFAHGGLTQADIFKALPACREWFDRQLGKAAQSIAMKVEVHPVSKMSTERLLEIEQKLARITGQEALIINPMPE